MSGKSIIKVKRDFKDPYLWVLAKNNEVYRINSITKVIDNYSDYFKAYSNLEFIYIAGVDDNLVYLAANSPNLIEYRKGTEKNWESAEGIKGTINSLGIDFSGKYIVDGIKRAGAEIIDAKTYPKKDVSALTRRHWPVMQPYARKQD